MRTNVRLQLLGQPKAHMITALNISGQPNGSKDSVGHQKSYMLLQSKNLSMLASRLRLRPRRSFLLLRRFLLTLDVFPNLFLPLPQLADRLRAVAIGFDRLRWVRLDLPGGTGRFHSLRTLALRPILQGAFNPLIDDAVG